MDTVPDALTEVIRNGARALLAEAAQAELEELLQAPRSRLDARGRGPQRLPARTPGPDWHWLCIRQRAQGLGPQWLWNQVQLPSCPALPAA